MVIEATPSWTWFRLAAILIRVVLDSLFTVYYCAASSAHSTQAIILEYRKLVGRLLTLESGQLNYLVSEHFSASILVS